MLTEEEKRILKEYLRSFEIPKIEDVFQEKYLEDSDTRLEFVMENYLEENLTSIVDSAFEETEYAPDMDSVFVFSMDYVVEEMDEHELIEAVEPPYRGLSPWERNPNLK